MKVPLLWTCLALLTTSAAAQTAANQVAPMPTVDEWPQNGEIDGAYVVDVQIMTISEIGPFTRFSITAPGHPTPTWFYVRSNDNTRASERGAIVGLLMGIAETYRVTKYGWQQKEEHDGAVVNFMYTTTQGRREIIAASLNSKLQH